MKSNSNNTIKDYSSVTQPGECCVKDSIGQLLNTTGTGPDMEEDGGICQRGSGGLKFGQLILYWHW